MSKTKVSSRGQVVIPLDIRKRYGIREGMNIEWIPRDANTLLVQRATAKRTRTNWGAWARSWVGLGKEVWDDVDPVEYTHRLWDHDRT